MVEEAVKTYMAKHPGRNADACETAFKPHRPGLTREESTAQYDAWAESGMYEEDLNEERYLGPKYSSEAVAEVFPPHGRDSLLILDVACGTGLVAEKLLQHGFSRFHGLDPSPKMLEMARYKNLYQDLFCCYLDANPLPMEADTYDGAVMSGGIGANMVPVEGLRQLARVVKPGGYVIIAARQKYAVESNKYRDLLEQEMTSMETEGIWRLESSYPVSGYSFDNDGVVWRYVIC